MVISTNPGTRGGRLCQNRVTHFFSHPGAWGNPVLALYRTLDREVGRAAEYFAIEACLLPRLVGVANLERLARCHNPLNR